MKDELEKQLIKDFPHTFYREQPDSMGPYDMFGMECGDGWYKILAEGAAKLEPLIIEQIKKDPEGYGFGFYRTSQIKEKYGTLRWYLSGATDEMYAVTDEIEGKSETICEQCGAPGKLRGESWYYTSCYDHAKEEDQNNLDYLEHKHEQNLKEK